jgi:hypothetical protein
MLFTVIYVLVGITFTVMTSSITSDGMKTLGEWAAFLISIAIFVYHIVYEHYRLLNPPRIVALRVSVAVALGAFLLATAANILTLFVDSDKNNLMILAFAVWPFVTAVPAFLISLAVATILSKKRSKVHTDKNGNT